ncbi:Hca operon transcriptional activator [Vibrio aerogenes CECT 7868]|uniref:Hca operon transcriptional activator n=1 Tax=Vibrio aerogenes CECT 7868 TaxID=1216006 RepID=A0A1M5Y3X5_9VIBR|nr:LysR substrate-binding domain-containing protein [Vibrio aerogenes]SHI06508.1 Hca operon transcriptional activator [Vibrio aerogenes CECT 7868]
MYLRYLQYFITVAEYRNFSRAAQQLNTVQPSISRQIKRLESIVGTRLLNRSPHELALTPAGEVFLIHAKIILEEFERAKSLALKAASITENELSAGLVFGSEPPFFDKVLKPAKARYPDLTISLTSGKECELVKGVKDGSLDAGFLIGPVEDPDLDTYPVSRQRIMVAISKHTPLADKSSLRLCDLAGFPLCLPKKTDSPFYQAAIRQLLDQSETELMTAAICCDNVMSAIQSVSIGGGCCFISDFQSELVPGHVVIKPLEPDMNCELVLITSRHHPSPATQKLTRIFTAKNG